MTSKFSLVILVLLAGCATTKEPVLPTVVNVPVVQPCPAASSDVRPARPILAIKKLTPDSSNSETVRAYLTDLKALIGYSTQLETSLDACQ